MGWLSTAAWRFSVLRALPEVLGGGFVDMLSGAVQSEVVVQV